MSLSAEKYIIKFKGELLKLYSAFYSGLELDIAIYDQKIEDMQKKACLLAAISHRNNDSELDFSIENRIKATKTDLYTSDELFSVVLCEEHVKKGKLSREGDFYITASSDEFKEIPRYKKYIRVK
jgi:hypothetical protein